VGAFQELKLPQICDVTFNVFLRLENRSLIVSLSTKQQNGSNFSGPFFKFAFFIKSLTFYFIKLYLEALLMQ